MNQKDNIKYVLLMRFLLLNSEHKISDMTVIYVAQILTLLRLSFDIQIISRGFYIECPG